MTKILYTVREQTLCGGGETRLPPITTTEGGEEFRNMQKLHIFLVRSESVSPDVVSVCVHPLSTCLVSTVSGRGGGGGALFKKNDAKEPEFSEESECYGSR